jgi:hypothetical protein
MKCQPKIVAIYTAAFALAFSIGALDSMRHQHKLDAHLRGVCPTQPLLEACVERAQAAANVRYFFNGEEFPRGQVAAVGR